MQVSYGLATSISQKANRIVPKWNWFALVGNSRFFRMTPLIPIFGYMIIFNDKAKDFLSLWIDNGAVNEISNSVEVRLYLMYFGFILVSLSSVVFSWRCPKFIKKNIHREEYVSFIADVIGKDEIRTVAETVSCAVSRSEYEEDYGRHSMSYLQGLAKYCDFMSRHGYVDTIKQADYKVDMLGYYYEYMNRSYVIARLFCFVALALGVFLISIPSINVFVDVCVRIYYRLQ